MAHPSHYDTRRLVTAAMCAALCVVLPLAFHAIPNAGPVFCPMHIPVLLCGLLCGAPLGFICGILGPVLSSVITGMPPAAYLPSMVCELAVYGLVSGLMLARLHTGKKWADLYLSLIAAMLAGRIFYGLLNALIFRAGSYSLQLWLTGAFVTALPGIVIQLLLLPAIVAALQRAQLAPARS